MFACLSVLTGWFRIVLGLYVLFLMFVELLMQFNGGLESFAKMVLGKVWLNFTSVSIFSSLVLGITTTSD